VRPLTDDPKGENYALHRGKQGDAAPGRRRDGVDVQHDLVRRQALTGGARDHARCGIQGVGATTHGRGDSSLIYIYIHMYIYVCMCVCVYIYI